jgi:hypothetical protein
MEHGNELRLPWKAGKFLINWAIISFSKGLCCVELITYLQLRGLWNDWNSACNRCLYITWYRGLAIIHKYRTALFSTFAMFYLHYRMCKAKAKQSRYTPWWRLVGGRRYSSYSFLTLILDGGGWSASRPGRALPRGKDFRYPLYRRLGGPQSRSGHKG